MKVVLTVEQYAKKSLGNNVDYRFNGQAAEPESVNTFDTEADKARFKRRATAVPNSIDRIKFDFSTALARRLKSSRATAV